jgi:ubiquitin-protein ligase
VKVPKFEDPLHKYYAAKYDDEENNFYSEKDVKVCTVVKLFADEDEEKHRKECDHCNFEERFYYRTMHKGHEYPFYCDECKICRDFYSCTCIEDTATNCFCTHIHKVHTFNIKVILIIYCLLKKIILMKL